MGYSFGQQQSQRWWTAWYRPMLLASIALHGLVLIVPIPSNPVIADEEELSEEETVDLSALAALSQLPSPSPSSQPEVAPSPSSAPSPLIAPAPDPVPALVQPEPVISSPDPVPEPSPTADITPTPTPTPSSVASVPEAFRDLTPEELQRLQALLAQREANAASQTGAIGQTVRAAQQVPINCTLFRDYAPLFFSDCGGAGTESQKKPEVFWVEIVPPQRRNRVVDYYREAFPNYQLEPTEQEYADGELYAILQGQTPILYLNIVSVGLGGSTTIAVLWLENPTQLSNN